MEPELLLASGMDTSQTYSVTEMQRHLGIEYLMCLCASDRNRAEQFLDVPKELEF